MRSVLLRGDDAAGVEQLLGLGPADQQRQGPGRVDPAIARRQKAELRLLATDAQVEARRQQRRAAIGEPVDRADQRLRIVGDMPGNLAAPRLALGQRFGAHIRHLVDVGAGREGALAGAGDDDGLDRIILLEAGERVVDLAHQIEAQRVQFVRPVQGDEPDTVEPLADDEVVCHVRRSFPRDDAALIVSS
jgi:hypothetical protein